jgi:hypothetical protein
MMLIAAGLGAALIAAASFAPEGGEAPAVSASSPAARVVVHVFAEPGVSATLISRLLAEAAAIWRASGFEFVWQHVPRDPVPSERLREAGPSASSTLRIVIGDYRSPSSQDRWPLGWIVFDDEHVPQPEIYLSHANAKSLMESARGVVGVINQMPASQREVLLARAMGRALAHELGHYLLASKVHTLRGLLQANRSASELFATASPGFQLDPSQRQQIAARMRGESFVASR